MTATVLASAAPVIVAPAMDGEMYDHPATRANVAGCATSSVTRSSSPRPGRWHRAQSGVGRLADLDRIVDAVIEAIGSRARAAAGPGGAPAGVAAARPSDLEGRHVVVTAGGTAEPIDPVRFIGNRSTGRMGVAIAEAALRAGRG